MKTKKIFPKLSKVLKSIDDTEILINKLILRVKENNPISDNSMLDGMIIGWIVKYKSCFNDLVFNNYLGRHLDSTIQKLEQITIWVLNNEKRLIYIYEN